MSDHRNICDFMDDFCVLDLVSIEPKLNNNMKKQLIILWCFEELENACGYQVKA